MRKVTKAKEEHFGRVDSLREDALTAESKARLIEANVADVTPPFFYF